MILNLRFWIICIRKKDIHLQAGALSADGSSEIYKAGESIKNLTDKDGEVVRLYARWQENSYNIEYNLNGGTGEAPENKEGSCINQSTR